MTTGIKVLLASGAFGLVVGAAHWMMTSEPAGTVLLLSFGVAPLVVAGYLWSRRTEPGPEDRADARPEETAGQPVGVFVATSAWPVILAVASMLLAGGLVFGIWLLLPAAALFTLALVRLAGEEP
jgi:Cytochrome c oxidase subunit IV